MILNKLARSMAVASVLALGVGPTTTYAADLPMHATDASNRYYVIFDEPGALNFRDGQIRSSEELEGVAFDSTRSEVISYRAQLADVRSGHIAQIAQALGRAVQPAHIYDVLYHGIVVNDLSGAEAARLAALPGVKHVSIVQDFELATDRVEEFVGAGAIWDGIATPDGNEYRGEGQVIAIIDTGMNAAHETHPAFMNDASCGHDAVTPKVIAKDCFSANCAAGNPYSSGNPHGSHVASTAGGNSHVATGGDMSGTDISGVAPCARIVSYKVCATTNCDGGALNASFQAILDDQVTLGITAANYSISGGANPWADADRAFLDMVNAGIFVAASAGNTTTGDPNPIAKVNHRGPWVATVANSTHDRVSSNNVSMDQGGPQDMYGLKGQMTIPSDQTGTVADGQAQGNLLGCTAFTAGSMTGQIALIQRGDCNFSVKLANAQAAGAIGGIIYNVNPGQPPLVMGETATSIPAVSMSWADGQAIRAHATSTPTSELTISATTQVLHDPGAGDILSSGSLRGPIAGGIEVTKPDITGPGTNIFAAFDAGANSYGFMSGTSMSGPHVAGAGALLGSVHPTWTPPELKSALMLTAKKDGFKDFTNGTPNNGPWDADDVGNGRLDLTKAALSGLVMHETTGNFLAASGNQANQRALNLPSMRNTACTPSCTFTRTVRNTLDIPTSWTSSGVDLPHINVSVSPSSFSFTGDTDETQTLTITVAPVGDQTGAVAFGEINLVEANAESPDLHMTVAVRGIGSTGTGDVDLSLNLFAVPNSVANGGTVSYIANVGNFGPDDASGVTLELELPAGVDYISGSEQPRGNLNDDYGLTADGKGEAATRGTASWGCTASGQLVTCTLTGVLANASISPAVQLDASILVAEPGVVTAEGFVSADQFDVNPANNTVLVDVEVTGLGDLIFANGFEDDTPPPRNCIDIDGSTANDAFASEDPSNTVWVFNIGANNSVTGVELAATITAHDPSWLSEARIGLAAEGAAAAVSNIGIATNTPGTSNAEGALAIGPVVVGADGLLRVERNETFNDDGLDPDSTWNRWDDSVMECKGLHLVCVDQAACDAGVAAGSN